MDPELCAQVLAELRAIAAQLHSGSEADAPLGQPDDVVLLLQPLGSDNQPEELAEIIEHLAEKNFLAGAEPLGRRSIAAALVARTMASGLGFHLDLAESDGTDLPNALFAELVHGTRALLTTRPKAHLPLSNFVDRRGRFTAEAIGRLTHGDLRIRWMGEIVLELVSSEQLRP